MMASTRFEPPTESINRIVRGLKALDNDRFITKFLFVRNISVRILLLTYIAYSFFFETQLVLAGMIVFGTLYFVTQIYVFSKFLLTAGYGFSDWKFLFDKQSKLSKIFIIGGIGLIPAFGLQLFYISETFLETIVLIPMLVAFISDTLTNVIVDPYIKHEMKKRSEMSAEQRVIAETDPQAKEAEYKEIALSILADDDQTQMQPTEGSETERGRDFHAHEEQTSEQTHRQEQLEAQAMEKLEEFGEIGSRKKPLALSPQEIDLLTEEELDALFADVETKQRPSHQYSWEHENSQ